MKVWLVAVTFRLTVAVVFGELVGVIVMVCGPEGKVMVARVEIVTCVVTGSVPSKVTLAGLKLQVAPAGRPEQLLGVKFTTIPVEPVIAEIVNVAVVDEPAGIELGFSVPAESWKSGSTLAFHATASTLASTEPRPVTRLYPVVVSAVEALNPIIPAEAPVDGQITSAGFPEGCPPWQ